jgi:hypothetical protein
MQTNDLIARLSSDLRPVPARAGMSRLVGGLIGGGIVAFGMLWALLGFRADFSDTVQLTAFWMKWLYGFAVISVALWLCIRFARPERASGTLLFALTLPLLVLAAVGFLELSAVPSGERAALWLGRSAAACPWIIATLSIPIFGGVVWAFRKFAPTQPRLAGFSAGGLAGAVASVLYAIHCNENAASFVVTWYSAGMLLPALLGLLIGPRIFRW